MKNYSIFKNEINKSNGVGIQQKLNDIRKLKIILFIIKKIKKENVKNSIFNYMILKMSNCIKNLQNVRHDDFN